MDINRRRKFESSRIITARTLAMTLFGVFVYPAVAGGNVKLSQSRKAERGKPVVGEGKVVWVLVELWSLALYNAFLEARSVIEHQM